jgi:hypothetical protein
VQTEELVQAVQPVGQDEHISPLSESLKLLPVHEVQVPEAQGLEYYASKVVQTVSLSHSEQPVGQAEQVSPLG